MNIKVYSYKILVSYFMFFFVFHLNVQIQHTFLLTRFHLYQRCSAFFGTVCSPEFDMQIYVSSFQLGATSSCPAPTPEGICQCLQIFLTVTTGGGTIDF